MSTDTIYLINQPSTSYQVADMIENNPNSLLLQSNESTANNQNIIHDDGDEIGQVVCSKNKRYKKGKRNFMSNCKYLGQEYEDRNGKQKPKKVFRTIKLCCKKNCFNLCPEQKLIFEEFYGLGNLGAQDQTLMDGIQIEEKKRATTFIRKSAPKTTHNRLITVMYNLQINGKMLNVCKKMFQNVYGIGRGRLDVIINKKKKSKSGISPKSGKGKSQNFQQEERIKILNHIQSFPAFESHYSRKNTSRLYLSQNLNIQKMFDLYKEQCSKNGESSPSNWLYRSVFAETGLKFKLPSVDTCKTCDEYNIKSKHSSGEELQHLNTMNQNHKDMVDAAYKAKQEDKKLLSTIPNLKVIVFDLQQCLPTPDLKTNVVFYKRQLWTYNETIRDIGLKETYCYMWHEALAGRGSNQIASILFKYILEKIPNSITHLVTYSDTCAGQNRNINVAVMFMLAIQNHPSLEIIDQKFLVPGHTHLECDTDHARIEKAKKLSDSEISIPIDWYNFVRNVRGKIPLKVVEMEMDNFKTFSALLSSTFVKRNLDVNKEKVNWLKITWLRYDKNFGTIKFKTTLDPDAPFRILDLKKTTGKTRAGKETISASQLVIPQTYNKPNPIDFEKKKDLLSLLPLIDPLYHPFYYGLKTKSKQTAANLNESSSDDE